MTRTEDANILDLFYRGRFEIDGKLYGTSEKGENYFYLDFLEDNSFEIFATEVFLRIQD
jgi:hypothetical protein